MSITVLAAHDLPRLADRLDPTTTILFEDRVDLASRLVELALSRGPRVPRTLDLVGLTGSDHLLTFHARALDGENRLVRAFWREIAELDLVARLGIESVRLIGCSSAVGPRARATIAMLSDVLGVPVIGSYGLVSFDDFRGSFEFPETARTGAAFLDLDSLRARPADDGARIITAAMGRDLLAQIRRRNGIHLPDLLARSSASLAIPSAVDGLFHHVEVMLDHELVRTGDVVFPVDDPRGLRLLLD